MEEMLKALMKKKKSSDMDPMYKKAKMGVLKEIHDMAGNDMGHDIKGLKKVEVASNDEEGLKSGLDKAKEMLSKSKMDDESEDESAEAANGEDDSAEEMLEGEIEHEAKEGDLSADDIDELMKLLEQEKAKLASKQKM